MLLVSFGLDYMTPQTVMSLWASHDPSECDVTVGSAFLEFLLLIGVMEKSQLCFKNADWMSKSRRRLMSTFGFMYVFVACFYSLMKHLEIRQCL